MLFRQHVRRGAASVTRVGLWSERRAHAAFVAILVSACASACGGGGGASSAVGANGEIRFGAAGLERGAIVREISVLSVQAKAEQRSTDEGIDIVEQVVSEHEGIADEIRATFRTGTLSRHGAEENDVPGAVSGKSYAVARRGTAVEVTMADGHEAPEAEAAYVRRTFKSLGTLRPLVAALRSSTWHVGDPGDWLYAPLREEVAPQMALEEAKLRLTSTRRGKASDYAIFSVKGRARLPRLTDAAIAVEGELEVALGDASVARLELRGRFKGEKPESGFSDVVYRYLGQR